MIDRQLAVREDYPVPAGFARQVVSQLEVPVRDRTERAPRVARIAALALFAAAIVLALFLPGVVAETAIYRIVAVLLLAGLELVFVLAWIYRAGVV